MSGTLKKAVVYARYSSHRQGEQSIEGQIAAAEKYATEHNLTIIKQYIDRAMTGRNDNRDAFQQMLKDTAKKQFDVIIVWKIDRFGRNREEIAFNKHRCKKNGVKVVYVAESIPDGPEGVILESVLEGMAEYYSLQLSQNILRGQLASAEKCQCIGGNRPLGYKADPKTKKFLIDEETAPTVRLIFSMYSQGKTVSDITTELNKRGLRTLRGKPFGKCSLYSVLKNEKYIGVYSYKDLVRVEGGVPAIVDIETFQKVQEMLKMNKKNTAHKWTDIDYLLTDKLFCGLCGAKMVGESGTSKTGAKHHYYKCIKNKREHVCTKKSVRQEWIEQLVLDETLSLLKNDALLDLIADQVYECYKKDSHDDEMESMLKKKLSDVEKSIANLVKAIEAGIFNEATKTRMDELDQQKTEIESELSGFELSRSIRLTRDHIAFFLSQFKTLDMEDEKSRKKLVETFINSIFVYDDKVTITFNYSGNGSTITLNDLNSAALEKFNSVGYGGDEESRTPVRKCIHAGRSGRSL